MTREDSASLGDIVAAAYDRVRSLTPDRKKAGQLAASAVGRLLVRTGNTRLARQLFGQPARPGVRW